MGKHCKAAITGYSYDPHTETVMPGSDLANGMVVQLAKAAGSVRTAGPFLERNSTWYKVTNLKPNKSSYKGKITEFTAEFPDGHIESRSRLCTVLWIVRVDLGYKPKHRKDTLAL